MSKKSSSRPHLFVGSSTDSLDLAYAIQQNLEDDAEVTVWKQGIFELTKNTFEALTRVLDRSDFGVFVFAPTDIVRLGQKNYSAVRDNVVFELGLFMGRLGHRRIFVVCPKGNHSLRIPTDLVGMTLGTFDPRRKDGNLEAALGTFCNQVRTQIRRLGRRSAPKMGVVAAGKARLANKKQALDSIRSASSISSNSCAETFVLERPRVPFLGGQQADFHLKELPPDCHGFHLRLTLVSKPYWRAGFVLAPEDYIQEGLSDIEITKYFLFHFGSGHGKKPTEPTEIHYQAYYNSGRLTDSIPVGFEPAMGVMALDVVFSGGTGVRVLVGSDGNAFSYSTVVDRSYIRYLYLLAWADGLVPFHIPVVLEVR